VTPTITYISQGQNKGGTAGQFPGQPTYKGRYGATVINGTRVLVNSVSHERKNFSENYTKWTNEKLNNFATRVLGWKIFKNISFKGGAKSLAYLERPNVWGSSWFLLMSCWHRPNKHKPK